MHKIKQGAPFLAGQLALAKLVEVLQLQDFLLDEFQGHLTGPITFAKPNTYLISSTIDLGHHLDLVIFFLWVLLVNAYGIYPKISVLLGITKGFESGEQIRSHILGVDFATLANAYICCWLCRSPAPGQRFVRLFDRGLFAKLVDDQFASDERVLEAAPPQVEHANVAPLLGEGLVRLGAISGRWLLLLPPRCSVVLRLDKA